MLSDKRYGLSINLMATRVMPSLLPQTVNPSLNLEQFTMLLEVLQDMLDHIDSTSDAVERVAQESLGYLLFLL
ncbi:unnamed protein product [Nezara viridula]|uniref:Uncharacterized protein n=1 Tax=Nezara viridula TaxID=85310 RepID=A0A9P0H630_NEZVI|nr:unnamed protein product [Nezara viridula]